MKKTQKKVLGLFGLSVVAATTVYAAFLPAPATQAVSSVTDTIIVRVIGTTPDVSISDSSADDVVVSPEKTFDYDYANVENLVITLEYTDKEGNVHTKVLETIDDAPDSGTGVINLDLSSEEYGYGDYTIRIVGEGANGVTDEDTIEFSYYPVTATAKQDDVIDGPRVTLDYDLDDENIDQIEIDVYDENGNLVKELSPTMVPRPETETVLDFGKYGLDEGTYTILVTALNPEGDPLYKPFPVKFKYEFEKIIVPDTGGMFGGLNISKTDYLATGLLVFGLTAVAGTVFAIKSGKKDRGRSSRQRR